MGGSAVGEPGSVAANGSTGFNETNPNSVAPRPQPSQKTAGITELGSDQKCDAAVEGRSTGAKPDN